MTLIGKATRTWWILFIATMSDVLNRGQRERVLICRMHASKEVLVK